MAIRDQNNMSCLVILKQGSQINTAAFASFELFLNLNSGLYSFTSIVDLTNDIYSVSKSVNSTTLA